MISVAIPPSYDTSAPKIERPSHSSLVGGDISGGIQPAFDTSSSGPLAVALGMGSTIRIGP